MPYQTVSADLVHYLADTLFPTYERFDPAHNITHIRAVIENSMELAQSYDVVPDMVYTIAAYHDIGIPLGRKTHHLTSGQILSEDDNLLRWFTPQQITVMREAIEDHRASAASPPRSIYGCIIAEADRDLRLESVIMRCYQYGVSHYPELSFDEQFDRLYSHMQEKYGEGGYLRLWLRTPKNERGLAQLRGMLSDQAALHAYVQQHAAAWACKSEPGGEPDCENLP